AALGQRVVNRDDRVGSVPVTGEISCIHLRKRHCREIISPLAGSETFPASKEEHLVLLYGPTASETVLVLLEWLFTCSGRVCEKAVRVQHRIAEVLVRAAMKLVRTRFRRHVDDAARIASVFGAVTVSL